MNIISQKYIKAVKKYLVCPSEYRTKDLSLIKNDVKACLEENPDASFHDLETYLGLPQSMAESYLEEIPSEVLNAYLRKRKRRIRIVIVGCIILIGLLLLLVTYMSYLRSGFTIKSETVVYPAQTNSSISSLSGNTSLT